MTAVVALIPARGGSKGVPRKNIHPLAGHPLIAWSIAAAQLSRSIGRVVVSTDDAEIAAVATRYGAEVPFLRPAELASDTATDLDVMLHALDWFGQHGGEPDLLVHLRPTTPLRDPAHIDEAVRMVQERPEATALRSAHALAEPPHKMFQIRDGYLAGFFPDDPRPEYYNLPRQMLPAAYQPNGYVDVLRTAFIRASGRLHGDHMLAYVTSTAVEVDRPEDLDLLEHHLTRNGGGAVLAHLAAHFPQP